MSSLPRATVHLENIVANWQTLAGLHPKATTSAVPAIVDGAFHGFDENPWARCLWKTP